MTDKVEVKKPRVAPLKGSQVQLINEFRARLGEPFAKAVETAQKMINDLTFIKLREIAMELGINLVEEDWKFDPEKNAFIEVLPEPKMQMPKPTTVKKRAVPKKKG